VARTADQGAMRPGASGVFVRDATGLVREVSWADAAMYNMIWASIPLAIAFLLLFGPGFYVGANLYLATIFAFVLTVMTGFLYAMMSSAIPRSGGDYTWITRAAAPPLGLMSNLSWNFWITFFIGTYAAYTTSYGLSPLLRLWAARTGSDGLLSAADWLVTKGGVMTVGLIIVILSGALLAFGRGLRGFMRVQRWTFVLWFIGSIIIPVIIMAVTSKSTVTARFDSYVADLGGPAHASQIALNSSGFKPSAFSLTQSILMVTLPFYSLAFIFQSVYFGGEIKRGKRSNLLSIPGAHLVAAIALLVSAAVFLKAAGGPLLASFSLADPAKYGLGFAPLYTELAAITSGNVVIGSIIILGFLSMLIIFVPQTMLQLSRNAFAWSFDRLLPEKLAEVNPRTHSPVIAVLAITAISVVSVIILALNPQLTFLVGLFGLTLTYLTVAIAGILFPYRQRDAFEASPYNRRIGKVPVISLVGVLSFLTMGGATTILLLDPNSGTNWHLNTNRVLLGAGIFLAGFPIYYVIRAIQRSRGIDVGLAFKEIPPE
jgi:APA family basic amino acid/polyamine antiporter